MPPTSRPSPSLRRRVSRCRWLSGRPRPCVPVGLLIPIRRGFHQYVNLRPVRLLRGMEATVKNFEPGQIDFYVVRENTEGEYSESAPALPRYAR